MTDYKTPNVYIEETRNLEQSVIASASAVPAFIGHTEITTDSNGDSITFTPTLISSLTEYESIFGSAEKTAFGVDFNTSDNSASIQTNPGLTYMMYHCVKHYFANGGGDCYIVSVGSHSDDITLGTYDNSNSGLLGGLYTLEAEDAVTLLVTAGDPVQLITDTSTTNTNYDDYCTKMLEQCEKLGDRFALIDAYADATTTADATDFRDGLGSSNLKHGAAYYPYLESNLMYDYSDSTVTVTIDSTPSGVMSDLYHNGSSEDLEQYHLVEDLLDEQTVNLPSTAAVAGKIAKIDSDFGPWKAPANVSLNYVSEPVDKIDNDTQADLNVDSDTGKSINAIRHFYNQGTLIWGARTLDGNSNEWRYIPVRRLFTQVESDIKQATFFSVFEPNTSVTWQRVISVCESYLAKIWREGGLQGASADEAFFVHCGLGKTMTEEDIFNGKLKVSIGLAAVRPAEFVVFNFTHYIQDS